MQAKEIRKIFLEFFKSKGHTIVPSANLIPDNDPTLLFTTAGMVQFKSLYAGAPLNFSTASTVQKCLRAGGKGSDLQNVGKTLRHHTFFEMLGNFSFGDYFKEEAITYAWEFITKVLNLPQDKLFVSVYKDDDEAYSIWKDKIGLSPEKIHRLGDADNFWGPAGNTGACGPCSEIYFDLGQEKGCSSPNCTVGCDCERYLEFWNLVFPQFYQEEDGSRRKLERRGVDTGMGLERLAFILQKTTNNVKNNYETDLFMPLIQTIAKKTAIAYTDTSKFSYYVIADHIKALTFALSENILPSNEGRGYVLRKILRRAILHVKKLEIEKPILYTLVPIVCEIMSDTYPELNESKEHVAQIIFNEEEKFHTTLQRGLELLDNFIKETKRNKQTTLKGEHVFTLYDTYGFPADLSEEIAQEQGLKIDHNEFKTLMNEQKKRAKQNHKSVDLVGKNKIYEEIISENDLKFVGYDEVSCETKIIKFIKCYHNPVPDIVGDSVEHEMLSIPLEVKNGDKIEIILEKTPFYAESGGQVGDTGTMETEDGRLIEITDTKKPLTGLHIHFGKVIKGPIKENELIIAKVNQEQRLETAKNHTATHILHYALKKILGEHVKQAGSAVEAERFRFDFSHFSGLSSREIEMVEDMVNQKIRENAAVTSTIMPIKEAKESGATALFGDKYGDEVRVIQINDYSKELCGGTHIKQTGEIGLLKILSETSIASGIRRIEGICSTAAFQKFKNENSIVSQLSGMLNVEPDKIIEQIEKLSKELKNKEKEILRLKEQQVTNNLEDIIKKAISINGITLLTANLGEGDANLIRKVGDTLKTKLTEAVIVLAAYQDTKVSLLVLIADSLVKKGLHAGNIIKEISKIVDGGGGGKPNMAQAGGTNPNKIKEALASVEKMISI